MYPNEKYPQYGIFVKNTVDILEKNGFEVKKVVMYKRSNRFSKLIYYVLHYINIIVHLIFMHYDYIYVHYASYNAPPVLIANKWKRKLNIITNVHGSDVIPEKKMHKKLQPFVNQLLSISNVVITPSNYFKNVVKQKYRLYHKNIEVFPSGGINEKIFKPISELNGYKLDNYNLSVRDKYIGFVGRIDCGKGWDIFLDSLKVLKNQGNLKGKALIVGNGNQYGDMQERIKKNHLQKDVICIDVVPQPLLAQIYNLMEVFCFPTMRKGESLGLVGLEAMACEVPVIGSNIGGLNDYLKDGFNGFSFETGNPNDLARKIMQFEKLDENSVLDLKRNALSTAKKYSKDNIEKKLINIFNENGRVKVNVEERE